MEANFKNILVPADGSGSSQVAFRMAAQLSDVNPARIEVFYVHEEKDATPEVFERIKAMKDGLPNANQLQLNFSDAVGAPAKEILKKAEELKADLIIMGTYGNKGPKQMSGSNAMKVATESKCPVISIHEPHIHAEITKIVLPIDLSPSTRHKVPMAVKLAKYYKSEIMVLGVSSDKDQDAQMQINAYCSQVRNFIEQKGIITHQEVRLGGNVAKNISEYATEANADMIIIMNEMETNTFGFFMGSFAQQVINTATIPVMLVPQREDLIVSYAQL